MHVLGRVTGPRCDFLTDVQKQIYLPLHLANMLHRRELLLDNFKRARQSSNSDAPTHKRFLCFSSNLS
jgi:hypothetical protein